MLLFHKLRATKGRKETRTAADWLMIINATKVGARALPRFLGYPVSLHHLSIVFFLLLLLLLLFSIQSLQFSSFTSTVSYSHGGRSTTNESNNYKSKKTSHFSFFLSSFPVAAASHQGSSVSINQSEIGLYKNVSVTPSRAV